MKYIKLFELSNDLLKRAYSKKQKQLDDLTKKYKLSDIKSNLPNRIIDHLYEKFINLEIKGITKIESNEVKKYSTTNSSNRLSEYDIKMISKSITGNNSYLETPPDHLNKKGDRKICLYIYFYIFRIEIY